MIRRPASILSSLIVAAALAAGSAAVIADEDHDRARQAREAGEILPLRTILERVERSYPGQVIDVELERDHDSSRWIYRIKLLQSGGALIRLKVDARDGTLIGHKGRPPRGPQAEKD